MKQEPGFQLLELLVVVAILSLLAATSLPRLSALSAHFRLQGAAESMVSLLSRARSSALSRNQTVTFWVHPDGRQYGLGTPLDPPCHWLTLPPGVVVSGQPATRISFHTRASAAPAGSLVLENAAGRVQVVVSVTGRIRWQRMS